MDLGTSRFAPGQASDKSEQVLLNQEEKHLTTSLKV